MMIGITFIAIPMVMICIFVLSCIGVILIKKMCIRDSNIRIAPSFPPLEELEKAAQVFVVCVKLASVEKLLAE